MKNLEALLSELHNTPTHTPEQYAQKVIYEVARLVSSDAEIIAPVDIPEDIINHFGKSDLLISEVTAYSKDFPINFLSLSLSDDDGSAYAAFTDYDECRKGIPVTTLTIALDKYLELVLFNPNIEGLIINPFGDSCYLSKEIIVEIFEHDYVNRKPAFSDEEKEVVLNDNKAVEDAIKFAAECHSDTFRKGTDIPYVVHPLEVAQILTAVKADYNLIIAGLLHDTVEDAGISLETIGERYGDDVAQLVASNSENKKQVWFARKLHTIRELPEKNIRVKLLIMADKLSNLRSMLRDYKETGEQLWERFNAPKEAQSWYFSGIIDGLDELQYIPATEDAYWELLGIFKDLFVEYYIDDATETIFQLQSHGENYVLKKGNPQWNDLDYELPETARKISRKYAETTEENWSEPFWAIHEEDMKDNEYPLYSSDCEEYVLTVENEHICLRAFKADENNHRQPLLDIHIDSNDDCHRFFTQFRIHTSTEENLSALLLQYFGTADVTDRFISFCKAVKIMLSFDG